MSIHVLAKKSLQGVKQPMALGSGRGADAAAGRCKWRWSMVQGAAWCHFVLRPSQAQQPSRGALSTVGREMNWESLV